MAAAHHGHIICLYAGRAVYCPKMATLQATLKAALDCLGLENDREVHFAFPHSDLAILVEISTLAFKNVRDGAILYLCDGTIGPVYPHDLALQAHHGQFARRPARAITPAPAEGVNAPAGPARGANSAREGRTSNAASDTRATRASRRLQRQANEAEETVAEKELSHGSSAGNASAAVSAAETTAMPGPSSERNDSSSSNTRVKRELVEEEEDEEAFEARAHHDVGDLESMSGDPYFKRQKLAN